MLAADPGLATESWQGNTLLEWCTQPPHGIEPDVIAVLIDAAPGHLDRALNLAGGWNLADLCRQLLACGANPAARADADITPLEAAAMHGSADSADVLVAHGLHRRSLWLAAAAGLVDSVAEWVSPKGSLLKDPGPYRPNWADVGRSVPEAPAGDEPSAVIGEALVYAAANGRIAVVDYLHNGGADLNARPYRNTTGLHFAVQFAKVEMVAHLLSLGADRSITEDEHGGTAAGWAEACSDGSPDRERIVALLNPAP